MRQALIISILFFSGFSTVAQELVVGLLYNDALPQKAVSYKKTRSLSLPFFEDFTSYAVSPYPDNAKWTDNKVYINNTYGINPISKGVATFDAINEKGLPYYPNNNILQFKADSLTSQFFDISFLNPNDSLYISFYYQPEGNGFNPEANDSLSLYFKTNSNTWTKVWGKQGGTLYDFTQANIAVNQSVFFHDSFQFRFINIASPNSNDDNWNIDYIRFDKNRTFNDTIPNDIAFTTQPDFVLFPYTSIPYRQYANHRLDYAALDFNAYLRNNTYNTQAFNVEFEAREKIGNSIIASSNTAISLPPLGVSNINQTVYNNSYNPPNINDQVIIEHKYYITANPNNDRKVNDTIVTKNIFDNYIAYDDGSAEKAYTLLPAFALPAKTALSFKLFEPDTVSGVMIRFGNQTPTQLGKSFHIALYEQLGTISQSDVVKYTQQFYSINYADTIDRYTYYAFDTPQYLNPGTYFIGTIQPAFAGIDTLYFGLDANTNANQNALYYNVDGAWYNSTVLGSIMMRPVLGSKFISTALPEIHNDNSIKLYPNPANTILYIELKNDGQKSHIVIVDALGQTIKELETYKTPNPIDISSYKEGNYFISITTNNKTFFKKFIKE